MNYKEYKEYIKDMTREQLIAECLSLKVNYDKSGRSWLYTESMRSMTMETLDTLQVYLEEAFKDLDNKRKLLIEHQNKVIKEKQQYYDDLEKQYLKDMKDE